MLETLMHFVGRKTLSSGLFVLLGMVLLSLCGLDTVARFDARAQVEEPLGATASHLFDADDSHKDGADQPEGESEESFEEELEERAVVSPAPSDISASKAVRVELPAGPGQPRQASLSGLERPPRV